MFACWPSLHYLTCRCSLNPSSSSSPSAYPPHLPSSLVLPLFSSSLSSLVHHFLNLSLRSSPATKLQLHLYSCMRFM
jgi:hypothetical protein